MARRARFWGGSFLVFVLLSSSFSFLACSSVSQQQQQPPLPNGNGALRAAGSGKGKGAVLLPQGPYEQWPTVSDTKCPVEVLTQANQRQFSLILQSLVSTLWFRMFRVSRTSEQCEYDFEKRKFVAPLPLETQRVAKWSLEDRRISSDPKPIQQPSGGAKDSTSGSSKGDGAEEEDRSSARNGNAEKKARKKSLKEEEADELDDLDDLDEDYSEDDATPASGDGSQRGAPSTMSPPTAGPVLGAPKPAGCMQVPSTAGLDKNAAGQGSLSKSACAVDVENSEPGVHRLDEFVTKEERKRVRRLQAATCPETAPEFWLDMCDNNLPGEWSEVNLVNNPEHNTGYQGQHVWLAMYSENCFYLPSKKAPKNVFAPEAAGDNGQEKKDPAMCYEQRVLYRLLSGIHTLTTLNVIYKNKPPRMMGGEFLPDPAKYTQYTQHHPERMNNLYFMFAVMLRALKRASAFFATYDYSSQNSQEDATLSMMMRRLLESDTLEFCKQAFRAFDEKTLFLDTEASRLEFKRGFQNISRLMNCVTCSRCRLHGKLHILGIGATLKILLLPPQALSDSSFTQEEVVAFFNTLAAVSHAIELSKELEVLAEELEQQKELERRNAGGSNYADLHREVASGERALRKLFNAQIFPTVTENILRVDCVVVGSGLAGLSTALQALQNGARVVLVEKEPFLGGNSGKASSGINAVANISATNDSVFRDLELKQQQFFEDTVKSGGGLSEEGKVRILVERSGAALSWLQEQGVDLSLRTQLGGHSAPRTYRPNGAFVGAEIVFQLEKQLQVFKKKHQLVVLTKTRLDNIILENSTPTPAQGGGQEHVVHNTPTNVLGIGATHLPSNQKLRLLGQVVLATGGFGHDRGPDSLLYKYRPDLRGMPTTLGSWTTGDGIRRALAIPGVHVSGMEHVQVHPTGFIDPKDEKNEAKTLAGEILRGVGGLLIDPATMDRFCNELGTRKEVVDAMSAVLKKRRSSSTTSTSVVAEKKKDNYLKAEEKFFYLLLGAQAAQEAHKHVLHYEKKGLLWKTEIAPFRNALEKFHKQSGTKTCPHGKTLFRNVPDPFAESQVVVGKVTAVVHYTMGGLEVDADSRVVQRSDDGVSRHVVENLFAVGEISSGVHGQNRLGGNSLLECVVFGRHVADNLKIPKTELLEGPDEVHLINGGGGGSGSGDGGAGSGGDSGEYREEPVFLKELQKHNSKTDCWVALYDKVYDFTVYAGVHPGGEKAVLDLCGTDGTAEYDSVHTREMLDGGGFVPLAPWGDQEDASSSGKETAPADADDQQGGGRQAVKEEL